MGTKAGDFKLTGSTDAASIAQVNKAIAYLERSPDAARDIAAAAAAGRVININYNSANNWDGKNTISFDPTAAAAALDRNDKPVGVKSPASAFYHEVAHSLDKDIEKGLKELDPYYDNGAERKAIEQEGIVAKQLGEEVLKTHSSSAILKVSDPSIHTQPNADGTYTWAKIDNNGKVVFGPQYKPVADPKAPTPKEWHDGGGPVGGGSGGGGGREISTPANPGHDPGPRPPEAPRDSGGSKDAGGREPIIIGGTPVPNDPPGGGGGGGSKKPNQPKDDDYGGASEEPTELDVTYNSTLASSGDVDADNSDNAQAGGLVDTTPGLWEHIKLIFDAGINAPQIPIDAMPTLPWLPGPGIPGLPEPGVPQSGEIIQFAFEAQLRFDGSELYVAPQDGSTLDYLVYVLTQENVVDSQVYIVDGDTLPINDAAVMVGVPMVENMAGIM